MIGLGIGSLYYSNNLLLKKTQGITSIKIESLTLDEQQRSLVQAKKDIEKFSELEKITKTIVPQEKDQAKTVRELVKISEESGITIASISFPSSTLGQAPKKAEPAQNEDTKKSATDDQSKQAPTATTPQTTQVKAVEGITGVYQMEISLQSDTSDPIPYRNLVKFLSKLEQNRRTSQVSSITVTPNVDDRDLVTFNVLLNVYLKP